MRCLQWSKTINHETDITDYEVRTCVDCRSVGRFYSYVWYEGCVFMLLIKYRTYLYWLYSTSLPSVFNAYLLSTNGSGRTAAKCTTWIPSRWGFWSSRESRSVCLNLHLNLDSHKPRRVLTPECVHRSRVFNLTYPHASWDASFDSGLDVTNVIPLFSSLQARQSWAEPNASPAARRTLYDTLSRAFVLAPLAVKPHFKPWLWFLKRIPYLAYRTWLDFTLSTLSLSILREKNVKWVLVLEK